MATLSQLLLTTWWDILLRFGSTTCWLLQYRIFPPTRFALPSFEGPPDLHPAGALSHPGKSIFFPPIPAASTDKRRTRRCFGLHYDVLAHPLLPASYAVPVRQYRVLQARFLHCMPHGKPACDLLMVQGVTPAHKGLAPSRLIYYLSIVKRCPCWAHTKGKRQ